MTPFSAAAASFCGCNEKNGRRSNWGERERGFVFRESFGKRKKEVLFVQGSACTRVPMLGEKGVCVCDDMITEVKMTFLPSLVLGGFCGFGFRLSTSKGCTFPPSFFLFLFLFFPIYAKSIFFFFLVNNRRAFFLLH